MSRPRYAGFDDDDPSAYEATSVSWPHDEEECEACWTWQLWTRPRVVGASRQRMGTIVSDADAYRDLYPRRYAALRAHRIRVRKEKGDRARDRSDLDAMNIHVISAVADGVPDDLQEEFHPAATVAGWLNQSGPRWVEVETADAEALAAALVAAGVAFERQSQSDTVRFSATSE